jgi:hypothetical protein
MERSMNGNAFARKRSMILLYKAFCFGLFMAGLVACREDAIIPEDSAADASDTEVLSEDVSARKAPSRLQLKEFKGYSTRHVFYYNDRQNVDSIALYDGDYTVNTYHVRYNDRGTRIDTVVLINGGNDGEWISMHTGFHYDRKGRITQYTYYPNLPWEEPGYGAKTFTIAYDNRGRISSVNGILFNYDRNNNLITLQNGTNTYTYTHNNSLNPLYYVPNLFALIIEESYWENILTQHNFEMKTYPVGSDENPGESEKLYQYEYDSRNRVIRMYTSWNNYGEVVEDFRFTYMN